MSLSAMAGVIGNAGFFSKPLKLREITGTCGYLLATAFLIRWI